jgi:hypothetical protein
MKSNIAVTILAHPRESRKPLAGNRGLFETSPLHSGDRVTATIFSDLITGTVQLPHPEVLFGAAQRGAEFAYNDRIWRVEFLADDGSLVCCHRDQCHAAGGAA